MRHPDFSTHVGYTWHVRSWETKVRHPGVQIPILYFTKCFSKAWFPHLHVKVTHLRVALRTPTYNSYLGSMLGNLIILGSNGTW